MQPLIAGLSASMQGLIRRVLGLLHRVSKAGLGYFPDCCLCPPRCPRSFYFSSKKEYLPRLFIPLALPI